MRCTDVIQYLGAYLDSELDVTTTCQIQAHLTRCTRCRLRFDQEHELEQRIAGSLMGGGAPDDGRRWERILRQAVPRPQAAAATRGNSAVRAGSIQANWIALVASLVLLAALASAGLGLRHSGQLVIPGPAWLQRFAQLPNRPMGGAVPLAGGSAAGEWGAPQRMPDA